MANQQNIDSIKLGLEQITQYTCKDIITRSTWGEINFNKASADIKLVSLIAADLTNMPLEYIPEKVAQNILSRIQQIVQWLDHIDNFNLESGSNPAQIRDDIIRQLHDSVEGLNQLASPQIPYLAYRNDDVSKNIEAINSTKDEAEKLLEKIKLNFQDKEEQINVIVTAAKDASANMGVVKFTQEFDDEATSLKNRSWKWLIATGGFAFMTILAAVLFYFWPKLSPDAGAWETIRNVVSKSAIIAVLFTATIWCGRIYRALMHQSTINRHRALSLRTFQAFVKATYDDRTKDAVLMAATRTIFGRVPTGLVNDNGSEHESEVNIFDLGRPSVDRHSGTNGN